MQRDDDTGAEFQMMSEFTVDEGEEKDVSDVQGERCLYQSLVFSGSRAQSSGQGRRVSDELWWKMRWEGSVGTMKGFLCHTKSSCLYSLDQGSAALFCKRPESEYFHLPRPGHKVSVGTAQF